MNSRYPAASVFLNKLSLDMRKSLHKMQAYHTEEIILPNNVQHQCHSKKGKSRKLGKLL
mgnify:CR=1 FL=1